MEIPFDSFINSVPFCFLIGDAAKPFYIHSVLVERHSKTLGTLVGGEMIEAKQGSATLDDIDEDTFLRFTQFAYTGDYKDPEPEASLTHSDVPMDESISHPEPETSLTQSDFPMDESIDLDDGWGGGISYNKKKKKKQQRINKSGWPYGSTVDDGFGGTKLSKGAALWKSFQDKTGVDESIMEECVNKDHGAEYTSVFLCHAGIYVFADRYGIESLGDQAIKKLRLTLARFLLHPQRTNDVVELVRYAYANTMDRAKEIDKLRDLVSDYVVCHVERLVKDDSFTKLLQENGDLAKDVVPKMAQRLE